MAKPKTDCRLCHGTGWELKPGTTRKHPCPICSIPEKAFAKPSPRAFTSKRAADQTK